MTKALKIIMTLGIAIFLMGCAESSSSDENKTIAEKEEITGTPQDVQRHPTCIIEQGTPLTSSKVVVRFYCQSGNIPIDSVEITIDGRTKSYPKHNGKVSFIDYNSFNNLSSDTQYDAVLEVIVGSRVVSARTKVTTTDTEDKSTVIAPSVIGSWKSICAPNNNVGVSYMNIVVFSDTQITYKERTYLGTTCSGELATESVSSYSYKIGNSIPGMENVFEWDMYDNDYSYYGMIKVLSSSAIRMSNEDKSVTSPTNRADFSKFYDLYKI